MKQKFLAIVMAIACCMLISACGADKKEAPKEAEVTPTVAATETPAPTATPEPVKEEEKEELPEESGFEEIVVDELEPED